MGVLETPGFMLPAMGEAPWPESLISSLESLEVLRIWGPLGDVAFAGVADLMASCTKLHDVGLEIFVDTSEPYPRQYYFTCPAEFEFVRHVFTRSLTSLRLLWPIDSGIAVFPESITAHFAPTLRRIVFEGLCVEDEDRPYFVKYVAKQFPASCDFVFDRCDFSYCRTDVFASVFKPLAKHFKCVWLLRSCILTPAQAGAALTCLKTGVLMKGAADSDRRLVVDYLEEQAPRIEKSDPKLVLNTMGWPGTINEWGLRQAQIWKGHERLPPGWIRIWSRSVDKEYYLRTKDMFTTFNFIEVYGE